MRKLYSSGRVIYILIWVMCIPHAGNAGTNGKKYFKEGMQYAQAKRWDKAAERLALAVAEEPSNIEYQLHWRLALVNASILYVELGDRLGAQKDYNAAYRAYQQAYAFDAVNVNTLIKMRHMLEALEPIASSPVPGTSVQTSGIMDTTTLVSGPEPVRGSAETAKPPASQRMGKRTDVVFQNGNLLAAIVQIAQSMHLNVAIDQQVEIGMKGRTLSIELRDVSPSEALEIILQTNNLMYSQVGRRTVVISMDSLQNRMRFEQMALRKYYIWNADLNDLKATIAATIGSKQIVASKQLNTLVVRDSKANLDLIGSMIESLDKSKAEVLIDISLYEVSQNDLLQLGNQFLAMTETATSGPSLKVAGGVGQQAGLVGTAVRTLKGPLSFGLGLPTSTLSFFQDKGKAKLLAFTQVHVLDNEQHQVRIGQRVPVKTGSSALLSLGSTSTSTTTPTGGTTTPNSNGLGTVDNIQYENVGLNIDMQPQVFGDEIQVKMKIESSSVDRSTGDLTPSFNQRTMSSMARIRDGQTTMIAAISRTEDSRQVKGIPFFGQIPILGRLFSTPTTSNQQSHVVITVTPHILRRADIRDEDHLTKDAGRGADANQQLTIQEILNLADDEDARQNRATLAAEREKNATPKQPESKPAVQEPSTRNASGSEAGGIVKNPRRDQR